ncbi:DUF1249 domain-containing protein [Natronospira bacteriovora]|uniref:DUF1249 domain-containing protein n=1 Tax=Natronospira bacteriovora TaxID=3069753 RepID=A0ABU0W4K8_9GAMM|nr:DUF1249 domain-containing protein [Natronospira sp. AB-CW4]MDQ2068395.1 DUF1249 domain-containing protein [Natronospira sp. AB-CW4]
MSLYEGNYRRLRTLVEALDAPPAHAISRVPGDLPLHLEVLERCPYTSTLRLTYWFDADREPVWPDPDLIVRIYHDARMAEVTSCCEFHRHRILRPWVTPGGEEIRQRWARNQMFHKWLEFCIENGHRF